MLIEIKKKRLCISFFKKKNFKFLVFYFYEENSSIMNLCYKFDLYVGGGVIFFCIN